MQGGGGQSDCVGCGQGVGAQGHAVAAQGDGQQDRGQTSGAAWAFALPWQALSGCAGPARFAHHAAVPGGQTATSCRQAYSGPYPGPIDEIPKAVGPFGPQSCPAARLSGQLPGGRWFAASVKGRKS